MSRPTIAAAFLLRDEIQSSARSLPRGMLRDDRQRWADQVGEMIREWAATQAALAEARSSAGWPFSTPPRIVPGRGWEPSVIEGGIQ